MKSKTAKRFTAIYRESSPEGSQVRSVVRDDYKARVDFIADLKANGYRTIAVLTDDEIEAVKDVWHEKHRKVCNRYELRYRKFRDFVKQCL